MYAVIRAGGKQFKVAKGDVIEIEKVTDSYDGVEFTPLVVVDDKGKTTAGAAALSKAKVTAKVVGASKGPKVEVSKFRNKSGYRRNSGHRQHYTSIEISDIKL
ncbi:MAG: 50S ribosomal protein L21 [Actinomycetota bacterium]